MNGALPMPGGRETTTFDVLVIGSGPAGQKAAIQAVKAGRRVAVIEQEAGVGGMCVHRGTIPSKTLRESALHLSRLRRSADLLEFTLKPDLEVAALMTRLDEVVKAHVGYMGRQLERNGIRVYHGRARFLSDRQIEVLSVDDIAGGVQMALEFAFETEGSTKPSCVAEVIFRQYE